MEINGVIIEDTYAEAFPSWISEVLITAATRYLAHEAGEHATGFASSLIGSGVEAGIDRYLSPNDTPDGRPGCIILMAHPDKQQLKNQALQRLAECVLTAPTAAIFDGFPDTPEKIPVRLHFYGDGYEYQTQVGNRNVWAIPIMGGEFIVEENIGIVQGIAGGNFLIMGTDQMSTLTAGQAAVEVIDATDGAAASFPSGVTGSGSKVGSRKYKFMKATTNDAFCPTIKEKNPNSLVPDGVKAIFEIIIDGVSMEVVKRAMADGIRAACRTPGVTHISAGNYGGTLGPYKFYLHELLS
ncbi:MAG TPA: formylmethanofuran--tetrahydromethanopterin N-formyltransferase [Methanomicrobiales archaeon]|nr:formylmethanofuran--tetrahydromethanopterin N-formyltransferase [Methanomicrobiales archaeon]